MTRASKTDTQTVKVLRSEGQLGISRQVITSADAARSGLPSNCVVMPMRVLKDPEPIRRSHK